MSVLWLIVVSAFTITNVPTRSEIEDDWVYATLERIKEADVSLHKYSIGDIKHAYSDIPPKKLISKAQLKYSAPQSATKVDFSAINKRFENKLKHLTWTKVKTFSIGFCVWLGSIIVVYLLGWAIGWVYRGFKRLG